MNQLSEREIRDLLTPKHAPAPPAGLAERIRSEIPEPLDAAPDVDGGRLGRRSPLRTYLLAASVLVAFGVGFLAWRAQDQMTPDAVESGLSQDEAAPSSEADATVAADAVPSLAKTEPTAGQAAPERRRQEAKESARGLAAAAAAPSGEGGERTAAPLEEDAPPQGDAATLREEARDQAPAEHEEQRKEVAEELRALGYLDTFVDAEEDALSAIAPGADAASYEVVRDFLRAGRLPPPEAVRVEELVNHFAYGGPPARGEPAIDASAALRVSSLVAEFAEILKEGHGQRTGDLADLHRRARELAAALPDDAGVAELASLIGRAAELRR
ncbi:MAG TPA: von Willebrand factor type A domain-containing protein [Thermoanaerobaculia bacterium]|jgi:hypothetical protein